MADSTSCESRDLWSFPFNMRSTKYRVCFLLRTQHESGAMRCSEVIVSAPKTGCTVGLLPAICIGQAAERLLAEKTDERTSEVLSQPFRGLTESRGSPPPSNTIFVRLIPPTLLQHRSDLGLRSGKTMRNMVLFQKTDVVLI